MKLLQPTKIGNMRLKNRIVMGPMGTPGAEGDGGYSQRLIDYYAERAKGGTGLIITGRNASLLDFEDYTWHLLTSKHHTPRLSALVDACHNYGAKICVQIGPGVGRVAAVSAGEPIYSCSAVPAYWQPKTICRELSYDDIQLITKKVGYSALLAKNAGADAVEIHAYGGYLADQFMTAAFNQRTDKYGGSLENRVRMLGECIESIRKFCGPDFPQLIKFTPVHIYEKEGYRQLEEGVEIARLLENWGAHALHVDTGCYEMWYRQIPTVYQEKGCQVFAAEAVKQATSLPVLTQGKLEDPNLAEQVLQEGKADLIVTGHQHIADPYYAAKVESGRFEDITPCIGCNECLMAGVRSTVYRCSVNPLAMHEHDAHLLPITEQKSLLIIGGGPGGMQAALSAAERGIDVELWEKCSELGGLLLAAAAPSFKQPVRDYVSFLRRKIANSNVKIIFGKTATAENIAAAVQERGFDKVVLAIGAESITPPIPGISKAVLSTDALLGKAATGERVAVIGGGLVGCELAVELAQQGKQVSIVERNSRILKLTNEANNNLQSLTELIKQAGINIITKATASRIEADALYYRDSAGSEQALPCDTVIIAAGYRSDNLLEEQLIELGIRCQSIGDAVSPGKIHHATHQGFAAALSI